MAGSRVHKLNKQQMRIFIYWSHGENGPPYVYEGRDGERFLSSEELQREFDDSTLAIHCIYVT